MDPQKKFGLNLARKTPKFHAEPIKPAISVFETDSRPQETEESVLLEHKKAVGIELARQNTKIEVKKKVFEVADIFFSFF
jgi:hypothetical protein